jgi:hypothetical protein
VSNDIKDVKRGFITIGKLLALLAAPFVLLALLFWGVIAYFYVSTKLGPPVHSSRITLPGLNATVTLEFYMIWDVTQESGRFLSISTPHGSARGEIAGFDWVHNARTSLYETPQRDVAVLGPMGDDYIIHLQTPELTTLSNFTSSEGWTYIGAFDLAGYNHSLQFFPALQQPECIPMRMEEDPSWLKMSRGEYRKRDCVNSAAVIR